MRESFISVAGKYDINGGGAGVCGAGNLNRNLGTAKSWKEYYDMEPIRVYVPLETSYFKAVPRDENGNIVWQVVIDTISTPIKEILGVDQPEQPAAEEITKKEAEKETTKKVTKESQKEQKNKSTQKETQKEINYEELIEAYKILVKELVYSTDNGFTLDNAIDIAVMKTAMTYPQIYIKKVSAVAAMSVGKIAVKEVMSACKKSSACRSIMSNISDNLIDELVKVSHKGLTYFKPVDNFKAKQVDELKKDLSGGSGGNPGDQGPDDDWEKNPQKAESKVWKELKPYKGKTKTNGLSGNKQEFYQWDYTHNDIEVYDRNGDHLGSMDPKTGKMYKPAKNYKLPSK